MGLWVVIVTNKSSALRKIFYGRRYVIAFKITYSRVGCPQMTWDRTLENALANKGTFKEFKERIVIAKDRPKWRHKAHSKLKHPYAF